MLASVLFPSTYMHSRLFYWFSLYVLHNKHAYFYPSSQRFPVTLWFTKRIVSLYLFIVVVKVMWQKKVYHIDPFCLDKSAAWSSPYNFCHNFSLVLSGMFDLLKYGFCSHKSWTNNNVYLTYELILWLQHRCCNVLLCLIWHMLLANTEALPLVGLQ